MRIPRDHRLGQGDQAAPLMYVARVARRASDGALALYATSGLVGAALLLTRGSHWWVLIPIFIVLAIFGLWGIVDRSIDDRRSGGRAHEGAGVDLSLHLLLAMRAALAAAGVIAALAAVLLPLSASLGNVIH